MYRINELYDLEHTAAKDYLLQFTYPWEALSGIKDFILKLGESLDKEEYTEVSEHVWIHKTATVFPSAVYWCTMYYWATYRSASLCVHSLCSTCWIRLRGWK